VRRQIAKLVILIASVGMARSAWADTSGQSGITFFRADVTVNQNATLDVREQFTVNNAASYYKYGFRRNLPIASADRWDSRFTADAKDDKELRVDILEVTRDGQPVRYQQGRGGGYSQVVIGASNAPIESGEHQFAIRYSVDSAIGIGAVRDTLYWNAIGHERDVPVAEAIVAIHLPAAIPEGTVEIEPRVGGRGVSFPRGPETTLERVAEPSNAIVYRARNVGPRQSLSLVLTWPSGFIHKSRLASLRRDGWMFAAPAALFLFYLISWFRIGSEPRSGPLVAVYEPPAGLSPARVRYLAAGATDGRSFAAVIAQLAVCGCLRVELVNGKYKLSRLLSDRLAETNLAPEEKRTLSLLFEDGPVVELSPAMDQRNTAQNGRYIFHIHEELTKQLGGKYFTRHLGIVALGVLTTFACALALAVTARGRDASGAFFFTMWILFCGLIVGMMIEMTFAPAWNTAVRTGVGWVKLLPGTGAIYRVVSFYHFSVVIRENEIRKSNL